MTDLSLDRRAGWPRDLRHLLERYPREVWPDHAHLGQSARFWLQRHDLFRDLGGALQGATGAFREGQLTPAAFRDWFVPRLQFFLTELDAHHRIEDEGYFPIFRAAEPRLLRGFEVLENDHEHIHERLAEVADAANALLRTVGRDGLRRSVDRYALLGDTLLKELIDHLRDEEDLVIPLILDRTEEGLGL